MAVWCAQRPLRKALPNVEYSHRRERAWAGRGGAVGLTVSAKDTLLAAAVVALVQQRNPAIDVTLQACTVVPCSGLRITVNGDGRWMFVSPNLRPGEELARALAEGACAAITIDSSPAEFDLALGALYDGSSGYLPIGLARWMAGAALGRSLEPVSPMLTVRERGILQLVARGLSNAEIAAELMISANTVRTHLHALSLKLEASSRTRMLANARALAIPEAFDSSPAAFRADRVPA